MTDIISLSELLRTNKEVIAIDILEVVLNSDISRYSDTLVSPDKGIYLVGSLEPILRLGTVYYPETKYLMSGHEITTFANIFQLNEAIVDAGGKVIIGKNDLKTKQKYFKSKPTIPVIPIKVAIAVVIKYLNTLSSYTHVSNFNYKLEEFIKPEYRELLYTDEFSTIFEKLLDQVMVFVNKDNWHIYFYKVKGTTLLIEKTIDFRIYEWYRLQHEEST